jgi:hypothetical protein
MTRGTGAPGGARLAALTARTTLLNPVLFEAAVKRAAR